MLDDLDRTLEVLLKKRLPPALASQLAISFAPPGDSFPPSSVSLPAIDLFLYDARANSELRSNDWVVERRQEGVTRRPPPVRVDCSYLITAWVAESSDSPLTEHSILGKILEVLVRYPTIPDPFLQGALANPPQDFPPPTAVLQPGPLQSLADLWQALGGKPKTALNYKITLAVASLPDAEAGPPITDLSLQLGRIGEEVALLQLDTIRHQAALTGRVTDAVTKAPLAGVVVSLTAGPDAWTAWLAVRAAAYGERWQTLPQRPDRQRTGPDGSFRFLDLPPGTYTLAATLPAAGTRYSSAQGQATVAPVGLDGKIPLTVADLVLVPTRVQGRVLLSGTAVHGATVTVLGSGETAFTDANGKYLLAGLETGVRTLRPSAAGLKVQPTSQVSLAAAGDAATVDFMLVTS